MANLSAARITKEYLGKTVNVTAGGTIYAGGMVAMNTSGKAVAATVSGGNVIGIAQEGATSGGKLDVRFNGIFGLNNGSGSGVAVTEANIGAKCYVGDDQTVNMTASTGTAANAVAGVVIGLDNGAVLVKI